MKGGEEGAEEEGGDPAESLAIGTTEGGGEGRRGRPAGKDGRMMMMMMMMMMMRIRGEKGRRAGEDEERCTRQKR